MFKIKYRISETINIVSLQKEQRKLMGFEEECKKEPSSPPMISEKTNTTPEDAEQLEREMIQELARVIA